MLVGIRQLDCGKVNARGMLLLSTIPAKSTIHAVVDRHGLVRRLGKRRHRATGTPLSPGTAANDLWCADYKGEFLLGNRNGVIP